MKNALLGSIFLASSLFAAAQPKLVSDINAASGNSYPCWLTGFNNKLVFLANDGTNGAELWALDTALSLQYDLNPGGANSGLQIDNKRMAQIGNVLYMIADNGSTGLELYSWNGSGAPTLAADVYPGGVGSNILELVAFDGKLYFNAENGSNGNELWSFNPATNYLQRLTDLYAGSSSSWPHNFIAYKGKLYFSATSGTLGTELYAYDPVSNTTSNVADILTGTGNGDPLGMMIANDKMYFSAYTLTYGRELYSFDGKNVSRLTNVDNSGFDGVDGVNWGQTQFMWYKGKLYFSGSNGTSTSQLFEYNPINGVASQVFAINPSGSAYPQNFTYYGGKMFFSANDGTNGTELWSYNGTTAPVLVADIDSGLSSSMPANLYRWGNKMYFSAYNSTTGFELYSLLDSAALTVQNIRLDGEVKVYPNPATSVAYLQINLKQAQQLAYAITDVTGKLISKGDLTSYTAGENKVDINMSSLSAGVYLYKVYDASGIPMASGRIEKQ